MFETLLAEAQAVTFSGWDFTRYASRWQESKPSWDFGTLLRAAIPQAQALLDLGTGGGEFLASLQPLPPRTAATEGYPPNQPIAHARLEPLGVAVIDANESDRLPFPDGTFDLISNRHSGFNSAEVCRLLRPGGRFLTQQVGGRNMIRLNQLLEEQITYPYASWTLEEAARRLQAAGLEVLDQREEEPPTVFTDIGIVVIYLRIIPWQIPDFTVEKYYDRLAEVHHLIQREGSLVLTNHRFYIEARKPC